MAEENKQVSVTIHSESEPELRLMLALSELRQHFEKHEGITPEEESRAITWFNKAAEDRYRKHLAEKIVKPGQ